MNPNFPVLAVNDYSYPLGTCQVGYSITDETGKVVAEDVKSIVIAEDSLTKLWDFDGTISVETSIMLHCG